MVGCWRCTYPRIHFFVSRSRSIVDCARVQEFTFLLTKTLSRSRSVVWCVHVACWWCVGCCVVVVRVCGVWWSLALSLSLSLVLSPSTSLSLSLSLSFFLSYLSFSLFFFFFLFVLLLLLLLLLLLFFLFFLLYSLLATKHYGKNRSTNTAANIEAFECDLAQGKCTTVGSLPPPLPSLLPSLLLKKREGTFNYRNIFGEGIIFITV